MSEEKRNEVKGIVGEFHGERGKKLLKCSVECGSHMKEYFKQVKERALQGEPVVWNWGAPLEILNCLDILYLQVVYWSALLSAKQMSRYYLEVLNSNGYFRDLCRYCTVPLGYAFDHKPEIGPWGGLPKFAAMVGARNDDPSQKLWELYAREFEVPVYMIDRSYMSRFPKGNWWELGVLGSEMESHRMDAMQEEFEGLIRFLETITGKHFSVSKLRAMMELQNKTAEYYVRAIDTACEAEHAPISWTDLLSNVPARMYFAGTQWALDHSRKFYEEIKGKVENKEWLCPDEKVRIWWDGHPTWFSLGFYNTWEEKYGTVFLPMYYVVESVKPSIRPDLDDPLRALGTAGIDALALHRAPTSRLQFMIHYCQRYRVNGVIFMVVESCKLLYTAIRFAREGLEKAGIPTMEINADMVDARDWDDTKMKALVSSYIETLMG